MICPDCKLLSDDNRILYDAGARKHFFKHPKDCGCECQHKKPKQWAKQYGTEQPK